MTDRELWQQHGKSRMALVEREFSVAGRTWTQPVMTQARGVAGAVVCASVGDDIVLLSTFRPVVGKQVLELPRGWADPDDEVGTHEEWAVLTGCREFREEIGQPLEQAAFLGWLYADTGLLASAIGVVRGTLSEFAPADADDEGAAVLITRKQLRSAIDSGDCCDGITLGALAIAHLLD